MTDVTAASSTDRWWLQEQHRDRFDAATQEGGQMAPRSWENRPDEGERFKKFLAGLNPLHHIPGVNMVYRRMTGETLEPGQQILGGALFGGVIGLIAGLVNAAVSKDSGKDIAGNIFSVFDSGDGPAPVRTATAAPAFAPPAPSAAAASPAPAPAPRAMLPAAAFKADGPLPEVLDLDALAPAAGPAPAAAPPPEKPPAKPLASAEPAAPVAIAAAGDDRRWFPARGRENPRGVSLVAPATPAAVMALQNSRAEGRLPAAPVRSPGAIGPAVQQPATAQQAPVVPVSSRAGSDAYSSALELSRELQKHYLGAR